MEPICLDAANFNGDARLNVSDPVYLLNFLFSGGPPPPIPSPPIGGGAHDCGSVPEGEPELGCAAFPPCGG